MIVGKVKMSEFILFSKMKTNLSQYLRTLLLALALTVSVSSFYVIPLRAGTTQITDNDLRSNKIIKK